MNLSSTSNISVTQGSGDIFADLGFAAQTAANLRIKAELMLTLRKLMQANGWSIAQTAVALGTSELMIQSLKSGHIAEFSIDQLIEMIAYAGLDVTVSVAVKAA
jgi:predicted XRE-type DNA-binding protein